jgi:hypothetical protein
MELALSVLLGIALAAAVGLRVFAPLLVVAVAAWSGKIELAPALSWLATTPAVLALAVAAIAEIAAYYVPGVDHLLDALTTPLALVAGTLLVAAPLWDAPPLFKWGTAVIAGGGAAGLTQGLTTLLRTKSTLATGGLGNPLIATGEAGGSLLLASLAIFVPLLAIALALAALFIALRFLRRTLRRSA